METIYRAFDGTEFVDEDDCFEYEMKKESEDLTVMLFDINMDAHPVSYFMGAGFDSCCAVKYQSKEGKQKFAKFFYKLNDSFGGGNDYFWREDSDSLYYIYDTEEESWIAAETKYNKLINKAKEFATKYGLEIDEKGNLL